MTDEIFFQVEDVVFDDLLDWSEPRNRGQSIVVSGNILPGMEIPPGGKRTLRRQSSRTGTLAHVNLQKIALFRFKSQVYAIAENCPHAGGPLHVGDIEVLPDKSVCVRCPWHSWCFDLETGQVKRPQGRRLKAAVFPTKVTNEGQLFVGFDAFAPEFFTGENFS